MAIGRWTYKDSTASVTTENVKGMALALNKQECEYSWQNLICTTWRLFRETEMICD